jgi:hypothetical protein
MQGLALMTRARFAVGVALWLVTAPLAAQVNPELGEEAGEPPPVEGARISGNTWQPPTGQVDNSAPGAAPEEQSVGADGSFGAASSEASNDDAPQDRAGMSDHQKMIGTIGVGFFGTLTVPVMGCNAAAGGCPAYDDGASVLAPTLGARYWWKRWIGFEAALGFNHTSGDTETVVNNGTTSTTTLQVGPTVTAFAMHLAVPFALADSGHFVFEVIPELNFGVSGGSYEGATAVQDWDIGGSMVEFGGRIGGEIHFGFIGIPQLALQGTIGLHLRHESRSATQEGDLNAAPAIPKTDIDQSRTVFSTTLQGEPWDIFGGSITAIYYL